MTDGRRAPTDVITAGDLPVEQVLAGQILPRMAYQPIADLHRNCVGGYEALVRFPGPPEIGPTDWFERAVALGLGLDLELVTIRLALADLPRLPPNTFLTVNTSPALLASPRWHELLRDFDRLDRLVVEVTEHVSIDDYQLVRRVREQIRERGALFAVDDAGSGYASMQHVIALRPDFVKIDRLFVTECDRDPARAALIEAVGSLAARLDAWIIAEGVERVEELNCLLRMGIPLAQGWVLGRPVDPWSELAFTGRATISSHRRRAEQADSVGPLVEDTATVRAGQTAHDVALLLDPHGRPDRWLNVPGLDSETCRPMTVKVGTPCRAVAQRAMVREAAARFVPVVCTDDQGRYIGVIRIERLVERLASR